MKRETFNALAVKSRRIYPGDVCHPPWTLYRFR